MGVLKVSLFLGISRTEQRDSKQHRGTTCKNIPHSILETKESRQKRKMTTGNQKPNYGTCWHVLSMEY